MAANSSSSFSYLLHCSDFTVGVFVISAFLFTKLLLLFPLSLLVFYLGFQRWRQQRSFATTSHSDVFTYCSAALELICVLGVVFYFCGKAFHVSELMTVGYLYLFSPVLPGETYFHVLTCVERYLAVVHPVTYLRLRQSGGVRVRNISIGCVWLLCGHWISVTAWYIPDPPHVPFFCLLVFSLVVVSFCSLSVLCVLIRPRPGEMARDRDRVDKSKQRAFHTITAITGVLWLSFLGLLLSLAFDRLHALNYDDGCLLLMCGYWFTLPSSTVLPLLFLQRAQKILCCHCNNK